MYFTLNELSLYKADSNERARESLISFSQVIHMLFSVGFTTIKLWNKHEFLNHIIADGLTIVEWLKSDHKNSNREKISAQLLKRLLTKTSLFNWEENERTTISNCPIIGIDFENSQTIPEGLKIAYLHNTVAVSLSIHPFWNNPQIALQWIGEIEGELFEQIVIAKNISTISHFDSHRDIIASVLKVQSPIVYNAQNILPFKFFSDQLVSDGDWSLFQKQRVKARRPEALAMIIEFGEKVALRNFYTFDEKLSALNSTEEQKRKIFFAGLGSDRLYLSIDMEKGGYEVCNYKGRHLGEYFFDGTQTSGPLQGHNIKIKS